MLKTIGFILLLASGIMSAGLVRDGYKRRKKYLSGLLKGTEYIINGISLSKSTLPVLIEDLSDAGEETDSFFLSIRKELEGGMGIKNAAERSIKAIDGVRGSELECFYNFGACLGEKGSEEQLNSLKVVENSIKMHLNEVEMEEKKKIKYETAVTVALFVIVGIVLL